jgi:hypothetical protein
MWSAETCDIGISVRFEWLEREWDAPEGAPLACRGPVALVGIDANQGQAHESGRAGV